MCDRIRHGQREEQQELLSLRGSLGIPHIAAVAGHSYPNPQGSTREGEHAASWHPYREICVEMELAEEEFTSLHLLRLL